MTLQALAVMLFKCEYVNGLSEELAGIVVELGGFEWAFAVNTVSFLAVMAAVAPLELPPPAHVGGESIVGSIRSGLRFARREPGMRALMSYVAINSLLAAPFIALVPAVALKVFHNEDVGTSALITAQGVGAVLVALSLGGLAARFGSRHVLLASLATLPVTLVLYGLAPNLELGVVAIFLVGAAYLGCLSSFTTLAQLRAPPEFRGRVMSSLMLLLGTLYPLGAVLQGWIADGIGLRATIVGTAVVLALALLAIRTLRPDFDRPLADTTPPPAALAEPATPA